MKNHGEINTVPTWIAAKHQDVDENGNPLIEASVYEVTPGQQLYRAAQAISKVGLSQFILKHPPTPPVRKIRIE
jgi:hypothetical protein